MKKKFISIIMLFAITLCFVSGCKKEDTDKNVLVVNGKEVIATINGTNYTADQIYDEFLTTNESISYIYEELEDLLIKSVVPITDSMRSRITNEVEVWKKSIKDNAAINGTSYKEDLASALESENVSSEEELIEKKLFALQEEIINNQYWVNNKADYFNQYLNNRYIYHVSQILVSVGTNGNYDYFNVEPSASVFEKLYNIVTDLASGKSFYQVAVDYSDDTASIDNGGDLGLITLTDSSLPNEVKYALASYSKYVENADIDVPEYLDNVYGEGIEVIPQNYIDMLNSDVNDEKFYEDDDTKHIQSLPSSFDNSRVYGRNIIFNNLFNSRTFRFLQSNGTKKIAEIDYAKMPKTDVVGFNDSTTQNVLVNDDNNPILVVRSDSGIHFISIKKSSFVGFEELKKYYSTEIDETDNYKTYVEKGRNSETREARIKELDSLAKEYAIISSSDNSSFGGNEKFIKYDMFLKYLNGTYQGVKFEIKNKQVETLILDYINNQKNLAKNKIEKYFDDNYKTYANNAEHADNPLVVKEIPILKCLENKECTYTYAEGFKVYVVGGTE